MKKIIVTISLTISLFLTSYDTSFAAKKGKGEVKLSQRSLNNFIRYIPILNKNMKNVLKDVLHEIKKKGLKGGHHLYITFKTDNRNVILPKWLKKKYINEMTIVIQYEYWDLKVFDEKLDKRSRSYAPDPTKICIKRDNSN